MSEIRAREARFRAKAPKLLIFCKFGEVWKLREFRKFPENCMGSIGIRGGRIPVAENGAPKLSGSEIALD